MESLQAAVLFAATITTGLSAGLFFAFACSVMPGLGQASDRTFVEAMQRINVAILNVWFLIAFVGAFLLTALASALHLPADARAVLPWSVAALVLYGTGLVITGRGNVPLNNALLAAGAGPDGAAARRRYRSAPVHPLAPGPARAGSGGHSTRSGFGTGSVRRLPREPARVRR